MGYLSPTFGTSHCIDGGIVLQMRAIACVWCHHRSLQRAVLEKTRNFGT